MYVNRRKTKIIYLAATAIMPKKILQGTDDHNDNNICKKETPFQSQIWWTLSQKWGKQEHKKEDGDHKHIRWKLTKEFNLLDDYDSSRKIKH